MSNALAWLVAGLRRTYAAPPVGWKLEDWWRALRLAKKQGGFTYCSSRGKNDSDNESVKGESLCEDHHKNEGDQDISLSVSTDTGITDDTNAKTSSEGRETAAQARSEGLVAIKVAVSPILRVLEVFLCVLEIRH